MSRFVGTALGLAFAGSAFVLVTVACSAPAPTPAPGSGTSGRSGSGDDDDDGDTPPPPSDDSACDGKAVDACKECCATAHKSGAEALNSAVLGCACRDPGVCATECKATLCAAPVKPGDEACLACQTPTLAKGGACHAATEQACSENDDCEPYRLCVGRCK